MIEKKKILDKMKKEMQEVIIQPCNTRDIEQPEMKRIKAKMYEINASIKELKKQMYILECERIEIL